MAEVIGTFASAVTIAALFQACVNAFDLVQAARHQEADYNRLLVKFNIEKCRLYTWGQMMRLTSAPQDDESRPLDSFQFRDLVVQTLQTLCELFQDSQKIKEHYGCREATVLAVDHSNEADLVNPLAAAFLHFQNGDKDETNRKLAQKARWVIRDRKKFAELISQIKELVDGLQEITKSISPAILQGSAVTNRINTITDVDTLQLISEVSEEDYPMFSQIASMRSEILSMSDTRIKEIESWLADETPLLDPEMTDLENMDISELKRRMLSLLQQRQQLEDEYFDLIRLSAVPTPRDSEALEAQKALMRKAEADNRYMKTFSLLSLVFLPGSFAASFMSMSEFDPALLPTTSFWSFFAAAVPITASTAVASWLMTRKSRADPRHDLRGTKSIPSTADQRERGLSSVARLTSSKGMSGPTSRVPRA